jgi:hypothetical protein
MPVDLAAWCVSAAAATATTDFCVCMRHNLAAHTADSMIATAAAAGAEYR